VSLDGACDQAATGLVSANASLDTGTPLTWVPASATVGGKLTPVGSAAASGNTVVVGHFVSFETNGSLVSTPSYLVSALSSAKNFAFAVFYFNPAF
jgi:hypothetical protein